MDKCLKVASLDQKSFLNKIYFTAVVVKACNPGTHEAEMEQSPGIHG